MEKQQFQLEKKVSFKLVVFHAETVATSTELLYIKSRLGGSSRDS